MTGFYCKNLCFEKYTRHSRNEKLNREAIINDAAKKNKILFLEFSARNRVRRTSEKETYKSPNRYQMHNFGRWCCSFTRNYVGHAFSHKKVEKLLNVAFLVALHWNKTYPDTSINF